LKRLAKRLIDFVAVLSGMTLAGRYLHEGILARSMRRTYRVVHDELGLQFAVPNALNQYRASTFSTKEPETLAWIDSIPSGSVFWDIGANVGLYSCYAAKRRDCKVIAFEPSVFNLELLARNVFLNGLTEQVTILPLPLSDSLGIASLNLSTTDWGGALSTFGHDYGYDGKAVNKIFEFQTLGLRMDDAIGLLKIPQPDFIKIDVDGIEHLVLAGGTSTLQAVRGVLVEINDDFSEQSVAAASYLTQAGLVLEHKLHSDLVEQSEFRGIFNQIWRRTETEIRGK
jgi:FkbM family methyltransferase